MLKIIILLLCLSATSLVFAKNNQDDWCFATTQGRLFRMLDHPRCSECPPPYCMLFENLFADQAGASSGVTSFSCETGDSEAYMMVNKADTVIRIRGTVYGGEDTGAAYGYGESHYQVGMLYDHDVSTTSDPEGWEVDLGPNEENSGFIRQLGSPFKQKFWSYGYPFEFKADGHLIDDDDSTWVGRGWLTTHPNHTAIPGFQDWIFVGEEVFPSRLACFWIDRRCRLRPYLPIEIGKKTLTTPKDVLEYLGCPLLGNPVRQLGHMIVVLELNIKAFGLEDATYRGQLFSDLLEEARALHPDSGHDALLNMAEKIERVLNAGVGLPHPSGFAICPGNNDDDLAPPRPGKGKGKGKGGGSDDDDDTSDDDD